ncbi:hypothetical protein [Puniceicoccus vermicola]|uniref:Uncharacterized protein n=1 Tax=Puniceicoccus vermicola TaxID=388746 RepID=A0A7X1E3Y4_9BACT|nr:hypothetical protein [Puniceicoccus vermicola]MBC2601459.1 hypothetical protein [Puniceicoccus vermicola]
MSRGKNTDRVDLRRLSEIRAGHGALRILFPESDFQGVEFEKMLDFAQRDQTPDIVPAASVVRRLVRWYEDGNPGVACRVLDAGAITGGMLWLQAAVNRVIRDFRRGRPAVLLVTGLCEAVCSPGRRWSRRAERERQENLQILEEQVHQWAKATGTPISLFVA